MRNTSKTKAQLLEEISVLRSRVAEFEAGNGEDKPSQLQLGSGRDGIKEKPKTGRVKAKKYQTSGKRKNTSVEEALQETEARFHLAFEEGIMAMATFDPSFHIVRVNRAFCEIFEYGEKELVGQTLREITHAEDLEHSLTLMNRMFEGELSHFHVETRFLAKSQTIVWGHVNYTVVRDIEGTPNYAFATIENITERNRAERELKKAHRKLETLNTLIRHNESFVQALGEIVYDYNIVDNHIMWTGGYLQLLGYSSEEMGTNRDSWLSKVHPADYNAVVEEFKQAQTERRLYQIEYRIKRFAGNYIWVQDRGVLYFNPDGQLKQVLGILVNITERKHVELQLRTRASQQAGVATLGTEALAGGLARGLMGEAASLIAGLLETEYSQVLAYIPENHTFLLQAGIGWQEGLVGSAELDADSRFQVGYTLGSQEPVIVEDTNRETRFTVGPLLDDQNIRSGLSVAISGPDQPIGVLAVYTRTRHTFTQEDIHFLQGIANVLGEIIARNKIEAELLEGDATLHGIIEGSAAAIYVKDLQGRYVISNQKHKDFWKHPLREIEGKTDYDLFSPEIAEAIQADDQKVLLLTGIPMVSEEEIPHKEGLHTFITNKFPLRNQQGTPYAVCGISTNITERKRAEMALGETKKEYEQLVNSVKGIVWEADFSTFQFTLVSQEAERLLGYPCTRWIKEPTFWQNHIHPEDRDWAIEYCIQHSAENDYYEFEYRMITADGDVVWLRDLVTVVWDKGKRTKLQGVMVDISELKQAENSLAGQKSILEQIALNNPLSEILTSLCQTIEAQSDRLFCSILLLEGDQLRHGAAPSLPDAYNQIIDGGTIGPIAGSCGTAAFRKEPVIVSDIATDPLWEPYKDLALIHGLRACCSTPILSSKGFVLGTFAMYYTHPRYPNPKERELVRVSTYLAGIAIERRRSEEALQARAHQQALVAELGQSALTGVDLPSLMHNAVSLIAHTLEVEYCKVLELLPDSEEMILRAGFGYPADAVNQVTVGAGLDSQAGYTLVTENPVVVEDLRTETRFSGPPLLHQLGVISGLSVIISGKPHHYGVLGVHSTQLRRFTHDDIHLVQAVSNVLGLAIERKQAEEKLCESERRLRLTQFAVDHAADEIFWADDHQRLVYVNEAACCSLGYSQEELLSLTIADVAPLHDQNTFQTRLERLKRGETLQYESRHRAKDGHEYPIDVSVNYVTHDGAGYTCAIARDITERKQAVFALSESEHRYRDVLANIPAMVAVVDNEQRYRLINKQYEDFWEVSSAQILGKCVREVVGENDYEKIREYIEVVLSGKSISFEVARVTEDGRKTQWLSVSYVPDRDQEGKIQGFYALLSDISERKQAQNQLRELSRQLRRAEEVERQKVARELHDEFGQLLTALKMDLGWLDVELDKSQPINKTQFSEKFMAMETVLNQAIDSVRRVTTLLRPAVLDTLGFLPALDWLAKDFQERTGIVCGVSVDSDVQTIVINDERANALFRIAQEFLTNVMRHAQASEVQVTIDVKENTIVLDMTDNGIGISPQKIDSSTTLGILGMKERTMLLGGQFTIVGKAGEGTQVKVALPLGEQDMKGSS